MKVEQAMRAKVDGGLRLFEVCKLVLTNSCDSLSGLYELAVPTDKLLKVCNDVLLQLASGHVASGQLLASTMGEHMEKIVAQHNNKQFHRVFTVVDMMLSRESSVKKEQIDHLCSHLPIQYFLTSWASC